LLNPFDEIVLTDVFPGNIKKAAYQKFESPDFNPTSFSRHFDPGHILDRS
jgi:hypothetical protein